MRTLSPKQSRTYEMLRRYWEEHGMSPTLRELRELTGFKSLNSIKQHIELFERLGLVRRRPFQKRNIDLVENSPMADSGTVLLPVIASAGCDALNVFASERFDEHLAVQASYIPKGKNPASLAVFKASGDSMEASGISSGDYVLAERTQDVSDGDRVVAVIGDMAVIKRLRMGANATLLEPESSNPQYRTIVMRDNSSIFGKVLEVIKVVRDDLYTLEYLDGSGRTEVLS